MKHATALVAALALGSATSAASIPDCRDMMSQADAGGEQTPVTQAGSLPTPVVRRSPPRHRPNKRQASTPQASAGPAIPSASAPGASSASAAAPASAATPASSAPAAASSAPCPHGASSAPAAAASSAAAPAPADPAAPNEPGATVEVPRVVEPAPAVKRSDQDASLSDRIRITRPDDRRPPVPLPPRPIGESRPIRDPLRELDSSAPAVKRSPQDASFFDRIRLLRPDGPRPVLPIGEPRPLPGPLRDLIPSPIFGGETPAEPAPAVKRSDQEAGLFDKFRDILTDLPRPPLPGPTDGEPRPAPRPLPRPLRGADSSEGSAGGTPAEPAPAVKRSDRDPADIFDRIRDFPSLLTRPVNSPPVGRRDEDVKDQGVVIKSAKKGAKKGPGAQENSAGRSFGGSHYFMTAGVAVVVVAATFGYAL